MLFSQPLFADASMFLNDISDTWKNIICEGSGNGGQHTGIKRKAEYLQGTYLQLLDNVINFDK